MTVVAGQRFGRLVTVAVIGKAADGHVIWQCQCDCGGVCTRQTNNLRINADSSCGCANRRPKSHGGRHTTEYSSWQSAIARCHRASSKDYPRYGARGIRVCDQWRHSFEAFLAHMGPRPAGTTLDRYPDNNGNYEPGNCRWATPSEQGRNRRASVFVEWKGARTHLSEVAAEMGITYGAAFNRLRRGKLDAAVQ